MSEDYYKSRATESKPSLKDPVFNRGCCKFRGEYVAGQKVLNRSGSKMNEFNWMKDYEGVEPTGATRIAEVRFKNDHKDFFLYPEDLDLQEGELVAVEAEDDESLVFVLLVKRL